MLPLLPFAAGSLLAGVALRWARREWRRVNDLLDEAERDTEGERSPDMPVLRRDRQTGEWRVAP